MSGIDGIFAVKGGKAFEAFDHSLPVPAGEVGSADSAAKKSIAREHHALGFFEIAHAAERKRPEPGRKRRLRHRKTVLPGTLPCTGKETYEASRWLPPSRAAAKALSP